MVYMDYGTPKFSFPLTPSSKSVDEEHIYSLDLVNDFANMYLRIFWTDEDGVSYDLGPEKFKVYNKTMTNITVDINDRIAPSGFCDSAINLIWDNDALDSSNLTIH